MPSDENQNATLKAIQRQIEKLRESVLAMSGEEGRMFQEYSQNIPRIFAEFSTNFSRMFTKNSQNVPEMFLE